MFERGLFITNNINYSSHADFCSLGDVAFLYHRFNVAAAESTAMVHCSQQFPVLQMQQLRYADLQ